MRCRFYQQYTHYICPKSFFSTFFSQPMEMYSNLLAGGEKRNNPYQTTQAAEVSSCF